MKKTITPLTVVAVLASWSGGCCWAGVLQGQDELGRQGHVTIKVRAPTTSSRGSGRAAPDRGRRALLGGAGFGFRPQRIKSHLSDSFLEKPAFHYKGGDQEGRPAAKRRGRTDRADAAGRPFRIP